MKRILYAGGSILTGDRIADALLEYAAALANVGRADTVKVPERQGEGETDYANILLGPASQLAAIPEGSGADEVLDQNLLDELKNRIRQLQGPRAEPLTAEDLRDKSHRHGYDEFDI